jgi:hypothetical protein
MTNQMMTVNQIVYSLETSSLQTSATSTSVHQLEFVHSTIISRSLIRLHVDNKHKNWNAHIILNVWGNVWRILRVSLDIDSIVISIPYDRPFSTHQLHSKFSSDQKTDTTIAFAFSKRTKSCINLIHHSSKIILSRYMVWYQNIHRIAHP